MSVRSLEVATDGYLSKHKKKRLAIAVNGYLSYAEEIEEIIKGGSSNKKRFREEYNFEYDFDYEIIEIVKLTLKTFII
jgi:hypothetical protein